MKHLHVHKNWEGRVFNWPGGGIVTADELLLFGGKWQPAEQCGLGQAYWYHGTVYHTTVETSEAKDLSLSPKTERSITLANGWRAHNKVYVNPN